MNNLTPMKKKCPEMHGKLNLIPDFKALIMNSRCNLHTIGKHCAKYEHFRSKYEREVHITSCKYVFMMYDLDL